VVARGSRQLNGRRHALGQGRGFSSRAGADGQDQVHGCLLVGEDVVDGFTGLKVGFFLDDNVRPKPARGVLRR